MGLLDKLFGRAKGAAAEHGDQVTEGVHKAADVVDDKTGGKYADKVDKVEAAAEDVVDKLDGEDAPAQPPPSAPNP